MAKLAILSSVQEGAFKGIATNPDFGFTSDESESALKDERQVFLDAIWIDWLTKKVNVEVVRAMDGIPESYSADAYILGGSPSMVTEREQKEWIDRLIKFVRSEVEKGKPVFGICFWHQILATAFGWDVHNMSSRRIWKWHIDESTNGWLIESLWSHKQWVFSSGDATIIAEQGGVAQIIQVWDNAFWTQFHPEFTPEFTAFLVKLMRNQLTQEWLSPDAILTEIYKNNHGNPSRLMLEWFVKKYYNL